ncbi:MAG: histidine kinase dimerization/phospho-acceptor domain-containing protein, partial [Pseudomonadota bacterium]
MRRNYELMDEAAQNASALKRRPVLRLPRFIAAQPTKKAPPRTAGPIALVAGSVLAFLVILAALLAQMTLQERAATETSARGAALSLLDDAIASVRPAVAAAQRDRAGVFRPALEEALVQARAGEGSALGLRGNDGALIASVGRTEHLGADQAGVIRVSRPLGALGARLEFAAPARDLTAAPYRPVGFALVFIAVAILSAGLASALIRQLRESDRQAANAADARAELSDAVAFGRCGFWAYDALEGRVWLSWSLFRLLGYDQPSASLSMRELARLIHPAERRTAFSLPLEENSAGVVEAQLRMAHAEGRWVWLNVRGGESGDGPDIGALRGVAFEISREKQAEARLAALEGRLKDAIETVSEAFVLWDRHGRLAMWNKKFEEFFHVPADALAPGARFATIVERAGPSGRLLVRYAAPRSETDAADRGGPNGAAEVELDDGRWVHISRRLTAGGGVVSIATDVSELKRQERARRLNELELQSTVKDLERSRSELRDALSKYQVEKVRAEDANRIKSEFLASMSHELRTPLNAINGFSEIMQAELYGPLGDPKYKGYVEDIISSGQHLLALIEDILDMSKIEAGKMQLSPERVDVPKLVDECLRLVQRSAIERDVALTSSVARVPTIWADPRALKQVALNILANAIKFTPAGGSVEISAHAELQSVTLSVSDTGDGIAPDDLNRLGVAFEQVGSDAQHRRDGSGLGLSLSKSLMTLQKGAM